MPIEGFDYQGFANELSIQAGELLPAEFQDFQKKYVISTIKNFSTLSGEAIYNDTELNFNVEQAMLITQIIAEWSFHKSVDLIKSSILPDYWDGIMQKIAFTIFEISKQAIKQNLPQDEILKVVEHHVKKAYDQAITELKDRNILDESTYERAINQSNIDNMMQQIQEDQQMDSEAENYESAEGNSNAKILKLASVALLLKQVQQDKVQTILNKFNTNDAQMVIQYMQMQDLETKVDADITMKCLYEIKGHLPEPKFISPDKILARMNNIFQKIPKEKMEKITLRERSNIKEFVAKAREGECLEIPSKVANIIVQHLEESI